MVQILYIEDDADLTGAVKMMLERAGHNVDCTHYGKQGLKLASKGYDLFLVDIMLPDISGWDIYEELKEKKLSSKVIFVTAIPISTERLKELKKVGVADYITKPFTRTELLHRIDQYVTKFKSP